MVAARVRGDERVPLEVLARSPLVLPVPEGDEDPEGRPRYVVWRHNGEKLLIAYTSLPGLASALGEDAAAGARLTSYPDLVQNWPDPSWKLALNPSLPIDLHIPIDEVAELLDPRYHPSTLANLVAAIPDSDRAARRAAGVPAQVLKVLPPGAERTYLDGGFNRVSGFVYLSDALDDLTSPAELYRGLGLIAELSPFHLDDRSVHVIRWSAHLPELYPLAYGAFDARAFPLVGGWIVEPDPFVGTGLAPGNVLAFEMKVNGLVLPHGALLCRLNDQAGETVLAAYDADLMRWSPVDTDEIATLLRS